MRSQAGRARRRYERNVFIQCWPSAAAGPGAALGGGAATMGRVGVWATKAPGGGRPSWQSFFFFFFSFFFNRR